MWWWPDKIFLNFHFQNFEVNFWWRITQTSVRLTFAANCSMNSSGNSWRCVWQIKEQFFIEHKIAKLQHEAVLFFWAGSKVDSFLQKYKNPIQNTIPSPSQVLPEILTESLDELKSESFFGNLISWYFAFFRCVCSFVWTLELLFRQRLTELSLQKFPKCSTV